MIGISRGVFFFYSDALRLQSNSPDVLAPFVADCRRHCNMPNQRFDTIQATSRRNVCASVLRRTSG